MAAALNSILRKSSVSLFRNGQRNNLLFTPVHFYSSSRVLNRTHEEASEYVKKELEKNWESYGFDYQNKKEDRRKAHLTAFAICSFFSSAAFIFYFLPDYKNRDWAIRESYIVLHERESKGLPLVDKNFIDPSKFELPTDEELADTEVII